jgi:hypothetical protein
MRKFGGVVALAFLTAACLGSSAISNSAGSSLQNKKIEKVVEEIQKDLVKGTPDIRASDNGYFKSNIDNIEETIKNYTRLWAEAVNENKFSIVEPYLIPGSELYKSQKKLLEFLYRHQIKEEFIASRITECLPDGKGIYKVGVYEEYAIFYENGKKEYKGYNWIYTVKSYPFWGLSDIESTTKNELIEKTGTQSSKRDTSTINQTLLGHWTSDDYYIETVSSLIEGGTKNESRHKLSTIELFINEKSLTLVQGGAKSVNTYNLARLRGNAFLLSLNDGTRYIMYFSSDKNTLNTIRTQSDTLENPDCIHTFKIKFSYTDEKQNP